MKNLLVKDGASPVRVPSCTVRTTPSQSVLAQTTCSLRSPAPCPVLVTAPRYKLSYHNLPILQKHHIINPHLTTAP
jgi:hypothetical protein